MEVVEIDQTAIFSGMYGRFGGDGEPSDGEEQGEEMREGSYPHDWIGEGKRLPGPTDQRRPGWRCEECSTSATLLESCCCT